MALYDEPYTISPPRTGDARLHRLVLTGWSNTILTWSDQGRMYWKVTTGNVLELFRHPGLASGDRVCYGTVSSGAVTLAQDNSSGISGSARVTHTSATESTGEVIVTYAGEVDLEAVCHSIAGLLTSSQWAGVTRFEEAFRQAKEELDRWIPSKLGSKRVYRTDTNELDLSVVAKPRQLAKVHAHLTAWVVMERLASINGRESNEAMEASHQFRHAQRVWETVELALNTDNDSSQDAVAESRSLRLRWG